MACNDCWCCDEHKKHVDLWRERLGANFIAAGLAAELAETCETIDGNGAGPVLWYYSERLGIPKAGAP